MKTTTPTPTQEEEKEEEVLVPLGGQTLETWIAAKNLGKYEAQLLDLAGDLHDLVEMTDDDAAELIAECKMPKLAARRFKKALIELGASVAP